MARRILKSSKCGKSAQIDQNKSDIPTVVIQSERGFTNKSAHTETGRRRLESPDTHQVLQCYLSALYEISSSERFDMANYKSVIKQHVDTSDGLIHVVN